MTIRRSNITDLPAMQAVFADAKQKMRLSGNLMQWTGGYPSDDILLSDIEREFSYVVEDRGQIVATFVLAICEDPTYRKIYNGQWLDDSKPYGTIHRIASREGIHGIMQTVLDWAFLKIDNIRIDTHRDNKPMQHLMEKHGFTYCGIIHLLNGDERLAFQKLRRTKAVLFDFDGTLVNSAPGIVKTMEQTFLQMGVSIPTEAAMRATIGLPLRTALQQLGHLSEMDADRAADIYRELFPTFEVNYVTVFPLVLETLGRLRELGIRMAIVTSRDTTSLDLIMNRRGMATFFETRVTGAGGLAPKPAPDMVQALLNRMELTADEALVVGDTTFDIEMGNSAGCRTVAVTYGNHSRDMLQEARPSFMIDKMEELTNLIG